ncbi:MAG: hypothetical protein NTU50_04590 [Actinobacteria bacterium]|nr:hypothetical protein [Actinomycetota bacterium]
MRELDISWTSAQVDRAMGVLAGMASGDAMGAGYEFQPPVNADRRTSSPRTGSGCGINPRRSGRTLVCLG